ncbi:MAG: DUF502 domain-containing protein [Proteobacteria bacterium]|nr:DUF502 domain-containing protein [Pseudomonadota bacterium]MBI3498847.1 DUF502 domain-containing protein [Pseudomonadota bacterium]
MTDPSGNGEPRQPESEGALSALHVSLSARLRAYFFAGVLITAPIAITIYLSWQFIAAVDGAITPLIPAVWNPAHYLPFSIPGLGLIIVVIGITFIGAATAGFIGRVFLRVSEAMLARMPIVRGLYGAVKQIIETIFAQRSNAFRQVALIEFPRPGVWTVGFIAGPTHGELDRAGGGDLVGVYVPTTPNPTSGYLLYVPRAQVKVLAMSVEDGLKLVVSCGIVNPPDRSNGGGGAGRGR